MGDARLDVNPAATAEKNRLRLRTEPWDGAVVQSRGTKPCRESINRFQVAFIFFFLCILAFFGGV